jgi:serine/threonine-protein kinase/endoribonuclease IRE1
MAVFVFAATHLAQDSHLAKYWADGTSCLLPFAKGLSTSKGVPSGSTPASAGGTAAAAAASGKGFQQHQRALSSSGGGVGAHGATITPKHTPVAGSRLAAASSSSSSRPPIPPSAQHSPVRPISPLVGRLAAADALPENGVGVSASSSSGRESGAAGAKGGEGGDPSYLGALTSSVQEPSAPGGGTGAARATTDGATGSGSSIGVVVGYEVDGGDEPLHWPSLPRRLGQQTCEFYTKTGTCRFAKDCCFDHPEQYAVPLTDQQLPYREGEPVCSFYLKTNHCKFGASCKFHHPKLRPIYAGSVAAAVPNAVV